MKFLYKNCWKICWCVILFLFIGSSILTESIVVGFGATLLIFAPACVLFTWAVWMVTKYW